jgi:hypothetical protein
MSAQVVCSEKTLVREGAILERCFTTPHTGKIAWEALADMRRFG